MQIKYTVHRDDRWMTHDAKRLSYERECDGCGRRFETGRVVVVTDRSGSEYAAVHDKACADRWIERNQQEERNDR